MFHFFRLCCERRDTDVAFVVCRELAARIYQLQPPAYSVLWKPRCALTLKRCVHALYLCSNFILFLAFSCRRDRACGSESRSRRPCLPRPPSARGSILIALDTGPCGSVDALGRIKKILFPFNNKDNFLKNSFFLVCKAALVFHKRGQRCVKMLFPHPRRVPAAAAYRVSW